MSKGMRTEGVHVMLGAAIGLAVGVALPHPAPVTWLAGYGGGIPAFSTPADKTPASMGIIMCDVSGGGVIGNFYLGPTGLHGARLLVSGQCDTNHGPHPRHPE